MMNSYSYEPLNNCDIKLFSASAVIAEYGSGGSLLLSRNIKHSICGMYVAAQAYQEHKVLMQHWEEGAYCGKSKQYLHKIK